MIFRRGRSRPARTKTIFVFKKKTTPPAETWCGGGAGGGAPREWAELHAGVAQGAEGNRIGREGWRAKLEQGGAQ